MLGHTERRLTLAQARKIVPRTPRPSIPTLWRWTIHGIRGVRLEHQRIGRTIVTSAEALDRFYNNLASAHLGNPPASAPSPALDVEHTEAERRLDELGL